MKKEMTDNKLELKEHEINCEFCRGFAELIGRPYKKTNDYTFKQKEEMR